MTDVVQISAQEFVLVEEPITFTVEILDEATVTITNEVLALVSESAQGPQGIPGVAGNSGTPLVSFFEVRPFGYSSEAPLGTTLVILNEGNTAALDIGGVANVISLQCGRQCFLSISNTSGVACTYEILHPDDISSAVVTLI